MKIKVFGLNPELWGVNVQPLSGAPANFAVYTALVEPNGRIMGLDLPDGGHLSHGHGLIFVYIPVYMLILRLDLLITTECRRMPCYSDQKCLLQGSHAMLGTSIMLASAKSPIKYCCVTKAMFDRRLCEVFFPSTKKRPGPVKQVNRTRIYFSNRYDGIAILIKTRKQFSGGTDNHLCLVDLRPKGVEGAKAEHVLDLAHITCNKNTCPGDISALRPGGIRLGTPALTSRGLLEKDFVKVAEFIHEGIELVLKYQGQAGKTIKDLKMFTTTNEEFKKEVSKLAEKVEAFSSQFEIPGKDEY
uniref:Glycine hydroxymethyltransferase n=1 Tax=Heterorhabditis bacteriophora TaxID=37862 RepID=A0A1I7XAK7_HETBA